MFFLVRWQMNNILENGHSDLPFTVDRTSPSGGIHGEMVQFQTRQKSRLTTKKPVRRNELSHFNQERQMKEESHQHKAMKHSHPHKQDEHHKHDQEKSEHAHDHDHQPVNHSHPHDHQEPHHQH
jgi:hypothetical protein